MAQDGAFYSKRLTEMQSDLTNFNPIDGLLAEPIVSLVTAVQMLQDKDPKFAKINLLARANIALMFAEGLDSDKMSVDQAASIHLYTQDSEICQQLLTCVCASATAHCSNISSPTSSCCSLVCTSSP